MTKPAHFRFDTRLALLLSETYRSSEQAIKELVDNAWDADATEVSVALPSALSGEAITIKDNGLGMNEAEVRKEYLNVASPRRVRRGERTPLHNRQVKGRKGIGKFAGLIAAQVMEVRTCKAESVTTLRIEKEDLIRSELPLDQVDLPLTNTGCEPEDRGTTVTLTSLNQNLNLPSAGTLKHLLVLEYGREPNFRILVNGEVVERSDVLGRRIEKEVQLPSLGAAQIKYTIAEKPLPKSSGGLSLRIEGKIVGKPSWFGLDERPDIPFSLVRRITGEIAIDDLPGGVTADWGDVISNSIGVQALREVVQDDIRAELQSQFSQEMNLAKARLVKKYNQRIELLPEHRREFARRELEKIINKFFSESETRIDSILNVVFEALEKDDYWLVVQEIDAASGADIAALAEALQEYGLLEVAVIGRAARRRLGVLDHLERLITNEEILEKKVH